MSAEQTFVTQLLRIYHERDAVSEEPLRPPDAKQVEYLCDVGLGPIAYRIYGDVLRKTDPKSYSILLSADMTTRVIYKQMEDATVELLASLQNAGVRPVLLKGASTAHEFYVPHYLRLMGDIDILIGKSDVETTIRTLVDLGYEIADQDWQNYHQQGHHHLPGARNPNSGVTIEVHTSLVPLDESLGQEPIFQPDGVEAQILEFDFGEARAARFTPEFQLIYSISHWGLDGNWAVNVTSINDVIHILRHYEAKLNWTTLAGWIADNPQLRPYIAALFNYLEKKSIVTMHAKMKEAVANAEVELQPRTMSMLLWMLHTYPFNAGEKFRGEYAKQRGRAIWRDLTKPTCRDIEIPYYFVKIGLTSIHHGKYNPFRLLWIAYRYFSSRLRTA